MGCLLELAKKKKEKKVALKCHTIPHMKALLLLSANFPTDDNPMASPGGPTY